MRYSNATRVPAAAQLPPPLASASQRHVRAPLSRPALTSCLPAPQVLVRADSVLIANTKGGGHAFLGLHLAKKLAALGHR